MGAIDSKKIIPPLPAPTEETEATDTPSEVTETDFSPPPETKSHYSLPEDGTPVTIRTRHKPNRSQTSLLIEYFEGPKASTASGSGGERRPSVRVRLTPSKNRKDGHIQVTETKSSRRASQTRHSTDANLPSRLIEGDAISALNGEGEDAYSMDSYASATEESNVSRQPIEVEIDHRRRRRPASPLIPTSDNSKVSYQQNTASEISAISAIPTDSFLDGSGPSGSPVRTRDKSPSRAGHVLAGATAGLAAAAVVDKARSGGRSESKERPVLPKTRDKERSERKSKNKSRNSSVSERRDRDEEKSSSRRRSSRGQHDANHSVADSSVVSSALGPSHRSQDQQSVRSGASKSSINNPKLLDAVEDAIRRLILPELEELKREKSQRSTRGDRRGSIASTSGTSVSREDVTTAADRRRSTGSERHNIGPRDSIGSKKAKETRNREARNVVVESPVPSESQESAHESMHQETDTTPVRGTHIGLLKTASAGAAVGALGMAALSNNSAAPAREERKRRRAEAKSRAANIFADDYDDSEFQQTAPMPLGSEINPSELTRPSILSAQTELDRPHSATEELTPGREVPGESNRTPTQQAAAPTIGALGAQHMNVSHGDLRALPRTGSAVGTTEFETDEYGRKYPINRQQEYEEYDEAEEDYGYEDQQGFEYYDTQHVPAPLKYEPYGMERRGLSPIPSVSGYTEGGSEVQARDSRISRGTNGSLSSPGKSPHHDNPPLSPGSALSNTRSREFDHDDRSVRSSAVGYRNPTLTEDSELGGDVSSGQAVRGIGANPNFVHAPFGVESAVASLVDGSMLDGSALTVDSRGANQYYHGGARGSMATLPEEESYGHRTPDARSINRDTARGGTPRSPATNSHASGPRSAGFAGEFELDQYGRKVPASQTAERQSPTASEAAITGAAFAVASAALRNAAKEKGLQTQTEDEDESYGLDGPGVQRNKSFKERTMDGHHPANTPMHSVDRLDEFEKPRMGASGVPDVDDPQPEYGFYEQSNPSIIEGQLDGDQEENWSGHRTPTQERQVPPQDDSFRAEAERSGHGLEKANAAKVAAGALATAAALASSHSRQPSQDQEDWQRSSDDRKRDTLVTNPFEGTSPQVNLPGLGNDVLSGAPPVFQNPGFGAGFAPRSPLGHSKVDEGYISQGANDNQELRKSKGKGVEFSQPINDNLEDPFYTSKGARHMSGLSQGMGSPLYDPSTGAGIDRIESKDIIALMQHLMVRDAQRSARDTEILMTLVRSAAEMRESFEKIKHMIADSEDVIIREVEENTEKTVQRVIGGPRPFPGSAPRSVQGGGSQAGTDDMPTKKQNMFRRALKGLSAKGNNDLGRIEDMLMQLLTEVDTLKSQTAGHGMVVSPTRDGVRSSFENLHPAAQYEHDRGYEPEGHAGTSTASHASQSGHLSIPPQSRGGSVNKTGYERKFSDHRISTVHEANEDEFDHQMVDRGAALGYHRDDQYDNLEMLHTPERGGMPRSGSVPVATPSQPALPAQTSASNENTPHTDKSKKHKSSGSSNWFPKISRWSETTASSVGKVFRKNNASRSGSDLAYDGQPNTDPYGDDKLHTGFTQEDLRDMMPEDPKYKAHRDSLNLRHPQPRPGQQYQVAIETGAEQFNTPHSPYSADWAHSATSLHRLQGRDNARPQDPQFWGSSPAPLAGTGNASPLGPPRPPKEPLDDARSEHVTSPKPSRVSTLQKSPLPHHSVESGYGTATFGSYNGSPKLENRNLSSALGNAVPTRRPSGPRAMTPKSEDERRRKRDTFGSVASQESETF